MAAVNVESNSEFPEWWADRNNKQAERLLKAVNRAKPMGTPSLLHIGGGDHPKPQGFFVKFLFPPFVWPEDSETNLANDSDTLMDESKSYEDNAMDVRQAANGVFERRLLGGRGLRTLLGRPTKRRRRSSSTRQTSEGRFRFVQARVE